MTEPRYLHGHHHSVLRSHRWRTAENSAAYLLPVLRPSMRLLDVGCGPGTITADLAGRLPDGMVVGIDASATVLADARAAAPGVAFVAADLFDLPFAAGSFDVIHLHQVLQHLADPVAALQALRPLLAPGGVLAARDADYGAMSWSPASAGLDRWLELYEACGRGVGGEPDAGRHLVAWAESAGMRDVVGSMSHWTFSSLEDRAWWGSLWAERMRSSALADTAVALGLADRDELEVLAESWDAFAALPQARFVVPHGEILCRA